MSRLKSLIWYGRTVYLYTWEISIKSKTLRTWYRPKVWNDRFSMLLALHDSGMSTVEIRDHLNDMGYKPPRTSRYTTALVWVTLKKLLKRRDRILSDPEVYSEDVKVFRLNHSLD